VATYADGVTITGEHKIDEPDADRADYPIVSLSVTPNATINPKAEAAILNADLIILGPGDLYTSILANCVVDGVPEALRHTPATLVYVANLMTKVGQTTGLGAAEHVAEIIRYLGRQPDVVLVNNGEIPEDLLLRYATENEYPVTMNCDGDTCIIVAADFTAKEAVRLQSGDVLKRSLIRHDSRKLARAVMDVLKPGTATR